jgi:hypothetical protein
MRQSKATFEIIWKQLGKLRFNLRAGSKWADARYNTRDFPRSGDYEIERSCEETLGNDYTVTTAVFVRSQPGDGLIKAFEELALHWGACKARAVGSFLLNSKMLAND